MALRFLFSYICIVFLCASVFAQEQTDDDSSDDRPIQITVEPAPSPNVTIQAPPAPNVIVQQPEESFGWRLVDPAIILLGIVIAAWMIIWQMGRQHRSSLELQKESARAEMRSKIYRELQGKITIAMQAELAASGFVRMIPFDFENYRNQARMGIQNVVGRPIVQKTSVEFMNLNGAMADAVIELIITFENYEIAAPEFGVFRDALSSATHDARTAFSALHTTLLPHLPVEMRNHLPEEFRNAPNIDYVPPPPNDKQLAEIQRVVDPFMQATEDIGCYLHDLRVESQNVLLKDIYPNTQVPLRKPIDPTYKVITSENSDELKRYFREETPWGRSNREAEARVREQLGEVDS